MGVFMIGRTLYLAIGTGDVGIAGPLPGTTLVNPNGPSSPIFSSVLAIHFSESVEERTEGFTLTSTDQQKLANHEQVSLTNAKGDKARVELIANFPDYTPNPLPPVPANIRLSNPFDLVVAGDQAFVTDGGGNMVREIDLPTGTSSTVVTFPAIPNPFFNPAPPPPSIGGPFIEAVPTGIRYHNGQLLVTLFRGVPFAAGSSQVQVIDPRTGAQWPLITGLKTAIDIIPVPQRNVTQYLVLEHASTGFFFASPGLLLGFESPDSGPGTVSGCLNRPTSMTLDERSGTIYATEYAGRVVGIPLPQ